MNILEKIVISKKSANPKYKQVVDLFILKIEANVFKAGQRIPSINETKDELLLSHSTTERAYVYMKKNGLITGVRGKGYYIRHLKKNKLKVALLFSELSNYQASFYYSLITTFGENARVEFFIYDHKYEKFDSIIKENLHSFDYFVIIPDFHVNKEKANEVILKLPQNKVIIIDFFFEGFSDNFTLDQVYNNDIITALSCGIYLLNKYSRLNLFFPQKEYYPPCIINEFQIFCQTHGFDYSVIDQIVETEIKQGEAYFIVSDDDLCTFIKIMKKKEWTLGRECGVVSFSEDPVKEIIGNGITTISISYHQISHAIAQLILTKQYGYIKIPFLFIQRDSL